MTVEWLTTTEAAAYAKVSLNTIRDAAAHGHLSGTKLTKDSKRSRWRFRHADIDAWLENGRATGLSQPRRRRGVA